MDHEKVWFVNCVEGFGLICESIEEVDANLLDNFTLGRVLCEWKVFYLCWCFFIIFVITYDISVT